MDKQLENSNRFNESTDLYDIVGLRDDEKTLIERFFPRSPARILIVGCGTGRTAFPLAEAGHEVIACDIAPEMIRLAQIRAKTVNHPPTFLVADAATIGDLFHANRFDIIWFPFHSLSYVYPRDHREKALEGAWNLLNVHGKFIFSMHNILFPRTIKQWLFRKRDDGYTPITSQEGTLWTYTTIPYLETGKLKKFGTVITLPRYTLIPKRAQIRFKERLARWSAPLLDKSFYFIAEKR